MADLNAFAFTPGDSAVHRMDPRFKLAGLVCISVATVQCGPLTLVGLYLLGLLGAWMGRVPIVSMYRAARIFFLFLIFITLVRGATTPGPTAFGGFIPWFTIPGLSLGLLISGRMFVVLTASAVFIATTPSKGVFSTVRWFLQPVPFVDGTRVAMMLSLMVRFIPVILDEVSQVSEAQKARCVEKRKNPVYRMKRLGLPLMERTFLRAKDLSWALTARNFGPNPTIRGLHATLWDWFAILTVIALCLGFRLLD